ncbi:fimbrial protein [Acinetobacter sp. C26M]|uniref:fimbrial protein n=1 Tax=unclassified Acinetobacter TaxID=196816 RepID=UPI0020370F81|nr:MULTISPECIES: fimbrial protein [unclassified Acinetobacter]USA47468.1 fimbrial protein [Acinetobacter sp. C26M]USA50949.1 fimbrial protein [Acinetobacter sp. C26G]
MDWQTGVYYTGYSNSRPITQTEDGHAAKIRIGNIHLMDIAIQPIGSVLAQASVPPTEYKIRNANAESLMWACSPGTDMSKIRFLTSVNGDDRVGGFFKVNPVDAGGQDNVFYTWFKGVGIRQVMNGTTLAPQWTELPIQYETAALTTPAGASKDKCQAGWHCIRLKHLPVLQFELIRVNGQPPYSSSANTFCNGFTVPANATGNDRGMGQSGNYNCPQPASYISLGHTGSLHPGGSDNGDQYVSFPHDTVGVTHGTDGSTYRFWGADNGFGYTLYDAVYLVNDSVACKVNNVTPNVNFGTTTVDYLNSGNSVSQNFEVLVDCHNNVATTSKSGTNTGKVAIAIQASQGAFNAAKAFSPTLTTANNGVLALLSDDYLANSNRAKNAGIYIKYQGGGSYLNLLGQPGATGTLPDSNRDGYNQTCGPNNNQICYPSITYPQGNTAGWYPVLDNASPIGTVGNYTTYRIPFSADLKRINGAPPVTSGTIYSTAYVVVKIQ